MSERDCRIHSQGQSQLFADVAVTRGIPGQQTAGLTDRHVDGCLARTDGSGAEEPCRLAKIDQLRPISIQIETGWDARVESAVATLLVCEVDQPIPILKCGEG